MSSSYYGPSKNQHESTSSSSQSRKRSRWGSEREVPESRRQPTTAATAVSSSAVDDVSDQDALQALLASARARQEEEERKQSPLKRPRSEKEDTRYHDEHEHADEQTAAASPPQDAQKANFGLSGALAKDEVAGNTYKGVVLKFSEPPEARAPNIQWRLYVFKNEQLLDTLHISKQSAYLFGRNTDVCDVPITHSSLSSQHAVLQYRALPNAETGKLHCQPYLMDLESTNGTFLNGVKIDSARYYQLKKGDCIKFGASTREYVLLTANARSL